MELNYDGFEDETSLESETSFGSESSFGGCFDSLATDEDKPVLTTASQEEEDHWSYLGLNIFFLNAELASNFFALSPLAEQTEKDLPTFLEGTLHGDATTPVFEFPQPENLVDADDEALLKRGLDLEPERAKSSTKRAKLEAVPTWETHADAAHADVAKECPAQGPRGRGRGRRPQASGTKKKLNEPLPTWEPLADAAPARPRGGRGGRRALTADCLHHPLLQPHLRVERQLGLGGEAKRERDKVLNKEAARRYRARRNAELFRLRGN